MIYLQQDSELYNNDLRAMIMAFYPGVKIVEDESKGMEFDFSFVARYEALQSEFVIIDKSKHISQIVEGDYRDKQVFRNKLKRAIYKILCEYTDRVLPWGDLTGVRPTKIAMAKLACGCSYEDTVLHYKNEYEVSDKKARLATTVAVHEKELVEKVDKINDYCLYVGIPFCPSRCLYCSFTSYPIGIYAEKSNVYIDTLIKEIEDVAKRQQGKRLVSVYVGGGTPTSITSELIDRLLSAIENNFDLTNVLEYTVEAGRPDSITAEKLQVMKKHNVTRISINPQTMNDKTLSVIGRAHNSEQTREVFKLARECGFENINMDIIAGLPGENIDSMLYTLSEIEKLNPDSLTVHSLAIKRAANLNQQMDGYRDSIHKDMDLMLDTVGEYAAKMGMQPYYMYRQKNIGGNLENVGYSRENKECIYNILIMEEITDIIAVGAGASTKLVFHDENRVERVENCKSVDDYIERFDEMLARKDKYSNKNINNTGRNSYGYEKKACDRNEGHNA